MSDYYITCVTKDNRGVILQVGIDGQRYDVLQIANHIWNKEHRFFTSVNGNTVIVRAFRYSDTNRPYLTTHPDGKLPNNLDYLPICNF